MTRLRAAFLMLLLGVLAASTGCHEADAPPDANPQAQEHQAVAAIAALAQSYHSQADIAVAAGDLPAAEAAMRQLLTELEAIELSHTERYEQRLDAYSRLARILIDQNQLEEAQILLQTATAIIPEDPTQNPSLFAGYLFQVQADLFRAQEKPRQAIEAHKEAILIFQAILDAHAQSRVP